MTGITGFGVHLPWRRLSRQAISDAVAWLSPALGGGRGERSLANWDEDAATLAVEAARNCLRGRGAQPRRDVGSLVLASLDLPFVERPTAALVAAALDLRRDVRIAEVGGSRRAGLSALSQALRDAGEDTLVVASAVTGGKLGSMAASRGGDGAVAIRTGATGVVARLIGTARDTVEFIDSFRAGDASEPYRWEDRWVRDEGYGKLVVPVLGTLLQQHAIDPSRIARFILPSPFRGLAAKLASQIGIDLGAVVEQFDDRIGDTAIAHPMLLLASTLETAKPGDLLLAAVFGAGCEAVLLEATPEIAAFAPRIGFDDMVERGRVETQFLKQLVFRGLVDWDRGPAAEKDDKTALSAHYRHARRVLALEGLYCAATRQSLFGAEADAKASRGNRDWAPRSFADSGARVVSSSADYLTPSAEPPAVYGVVEFDEGGRLNMDFTDAAADDVGVAATVEMAFRIHAHDRERGFTRYGWKAIPVRASKGGN